LEILVTRQLRLRMKRSLVGVIWPVVSPALLLVLYVFVFGGVFHVPIPRYPEFLFAGLLPWTFLALTLGAAVSSLSVEAEMIRRAPFPTELIPVATATAMSIYFVATLAVFVLYLGLTGHLAIRVLPAILVPVASLYLFVLAMALVLALVDVYNRDLRQVLGNLLTAWFFLVPIVYRQEMLGSQLHFLQSVDPANVIVGQFREILYSGRVSRPDHLVQMIVVCLVFYIAARTVFRRFTRALPLRV
jgi:lipopolysaccharide transport system permease protein